MAWKISLKILLQLSSQRDDTRTRWLMLKRFSNTYLKFKRKRRSFLSIDHSLSSPQRTKSNIYSFIHWQGRESSVFLGEKMHYSVTFASFLADDKIFSEFCSRVVSFNGSTQFLWWMRKTTNWYQGKIIA